MANISKIEVDGTTYDIEDAVARSRSGGGLSDEAKQALLSIFQDVAFINSTAQTKYDALEVALYPPANLSYISAVYTQSGAVKTSDSLDSLKTDLVVTAHYDDMSTATVTNYTLSGVLAAGTSTITVSYGGKTTTFNVTVTEDLLPEGYTQIEYCERPSGTQEAYGFNTTGFMPNGTDTVVVKMGIMATATPSSSNGGYFLICHQRTTDNTVGFGIGVSQDLLTAYAYDGTLADISPNGGSSIVNKKIDLEVTKTSTGLTVTDGTNTKTTTGTPREMASNLYIFGLYPSSGTTLAAPSFGRIYYLNIVEGGVEKVNFIPCKRDSDNEIGFYDSVSGTFRRSSVYVAGPEV